MVTYPVEIRRCQHIKTNGTQCASPALRDDKFCHYHQECRPERVEIKGADGKTCKILVPLFEDGNSIQTMVRQVAVLLLQDKIDSKKAGQVLYALQIASSNLKRMEEEKPRPEQVVVDTEKVGETPLGRTPWSRRGEGHDAESVCEEIERVELEKDQIYRAWDKEYRKKRDDIQKKADELGVWLAHNPAPSKDDLKSQLDSISTSLWLTLRSMGRALGERQPGD